MKAFASILIPLMLAITIVSADKRPRVSFFQRQTQSSADKKPTGADSGPYPPSNSGPSGPYPPSGWKPDGPQLEYGTPEKNPSKGNSPAEGASNSSSSTTPAPSDASPSKLVSFVQPESNVYYYVLNEGRIQPLLLEPVSAALVQQNGSPRRLILTKSLQLQAREVEPVQEPVYAYTGPLVRVVRNA